MSDPSKFICERCLREFKRRGDLTRHLNKKTPCTPVAEKIAETVEKEVAARVKVEVAARAPAEEGPVATDEGLHRIVYRSRDILRSVGIIERDAFDSIVLLFMLRELEKVYPQLADPTKYKLNITSGIDVAFSVREKLQCFSGIAASHFDEFDVRKDCWDTIVRTAFLTPRYCEGVPTEVANLIENIANVHDGFASGFNVRNSRAAFDIVQNVNNYAGTLDLLGKVLMGMMREGTLGNELGQHFTPESVIECAIEAVVEDGRPLGDVIDPTCGSGRFLVLANQRGATSVTGVEINDQAYPMTCINLLTELKCMPTGAKKGNIFDVRGLGQYDTILNNPPFGIKGISRPNLISSTDGGADMYPMGSSATGLFVMRIVSLLKIGGRAAVVLPLGRELGGISNVDVNFRKVLLKALNFRKIIAMPSGTFKTTGIETVIVVFDKVRELAGCFKESGRTTKKRTFDTSIENATAEIRIATLVKNADGTISKVPVDMTKQTITMEEIEAKNFSLNPKDYAQLVGQEMHKDIETGYPMVKIGDLFDFKKGTIQSSKAIPGEFQLLSMSLIHTHDIATEYDETLVITTTYLGGGSSGIRIFYHPGPCATATVVSKLIKRRENVSLKYVFYYLNNIRAAIEHICEKGLCGKTLDKTKFLNMAIPLPPLEIQQQIVEILDAISARTSSISDLIEDLKRASKTICRSAERRGEKRKIGDLFELKKGTVQSSKAIPGDIPFYTGAAEIKFHNTATDISESLLFVGGAEGSLGRVHHPKESEYAVSDLCYTMRLRNHGVCMYRYVYWYLNMNRNTVVEQFARGVKRTITAERLREIRLSVPPLEIQQRIVIELDQIQAEIESLGRLRDTFKESMRFHLEGFLSEKNEPAEMVTNSVQEDELAGVYGPEVNM